MTGAAGSARVWPVLLFLALLLGAIPGLAAAQDAPAEDEGRDRVVAEGRVVYEANCIGCHQADGRGVSGVFPPLLDNPRTADAVYVTEVVRNGLQGEIEVLGETYNGAMPAFVSLSDEQVDSLIVYLQEGLGMAAPPAPAPGPAGDGLAGTSLPGTAELLALLGFLIFLGVGAFVMGPVAIAPAGAGDFTTAQVWIKSILIVLYFVVATVVLPSRLIEAEFLASPPSVWGDLFSTDLWDTIRSVLVTGVWLVALGVGVWGLRRIQRRGVI